MTSHELTGYAEILLVRTRSRDQLPKQNNTVKIVVFDLTFCRPFANVIRHGTKKLRRNSVGNCVAHVEQVQQPESTAPVEQAFRS